MDQLRDRILELHQFASPNDKQLTMALVYGVLRHQRYLDFILSEFSKHPLQKMKNLTLQALRVGLFQICLMDKIPPSAAVNETVKALRQAKQPKWLTGFVNGLLRNIVRKKDEAKPCSSKTMPLTVQFSHPDWLFERWKKRYGEEKTTQICQTNNLQPSLSLRVNTQLIDRDQYIDALCKINIGAEPGITSESIRLLHFKGHISRLPGYENGYFMVQDEGAQLISLMLCPLPQGKTLDACAGLGGKAIHLAQMLPPESELVAIEPDKNRFSLLLQNMVRMKQGSQLRVLQTNLADFRSQTDTLFQSILVDAPCSGLGVIRRHPDIRWNRCENDLERYQTNQIDLLNEASALLSSGGSLVYATCSTEPEENELVVAKFLESHSDFRIDKPQEIPETARNMIDAQGYLRMLPDKFHDGFFAAKLLKA